MPNDENSDKTFINQDLGYVFYPKKYPRAPGHPRVAIYLRNIPTEQHFDPEKVRLPVRDKPEWSKYDQLRPLTISHPWLHKDECTVCAGKVIISDRKGKRVEAFTFGGKIDFNLSQSTTVCRLNSHAPILRLLQTGSMPMVLAKEVEILLAKRGAAWIQQIHEYKNKLANVPADMLYYSCLESLREKYEHFHHKELSQIQYFLHFVHAEIRALQKDGLWPTKVPSLPDLL